MKKIHNRIPAQSGSILNHPYTIYVLMAVMAIFWYPALLNGFTNWDDHVYLTDNPMIKDFSLQGIANIFTGFLMGNYHPLVPLSFMLEYKIAGMNPFIYHFNNVLIHLLNVYLVYYILKYFLQHTPAALMGAVFFGLHPLHVESVAWVTERKDVLYTFFFLMATLQWLYFLNSGKSKNYMFALILFVLSCLSKGMAVVWPLWIILLQYGWAQKDRYLPVLRFIRENIQSWILPVIIAIGFGLLAIYAQKSGGAVRDESPFLFPDNILVASHGILFYIYKTLLPFQLSAFYPYPEPARTFPWYWYVSPFIILTITGYIMYLWSKGKPSAGIAWFGYVGILLPVSQLLPVGSAMAADRYFYLASLGVCLGLAYLWKQHEIKISRILQYSLFSVLILFWGILTWHRTQVWKDTESLFVNVIKNYPNVPVAYNNIGNVYEHKKEYELAKNWYLQSLKYRADYSEGLMNMGVVYERLSRYDSALWYYHTLKEFHPGHPKIHSVIANAYNKYGNRLRESGDWAKADIMFHSSISWDKQYTEAYNNLGNLYYSTGRIDSGIVLIKEAIRLRPEYAEAWSNLGSIYGATGKTDSAIVCFENAVRINEGYAPAWFNLGYAYRISGNVPKAKQALEKAAGLGHTGAQEILQSGL